MSVDTYHNTQWCNVSSLPDQRDYNDEEKKEEEELSEKGAKFRYQTTLISFLFTVPLNGSSSTIDKYIECR